VDIRGSMPLFGNRNFISIPQVPVTLKKYTKEVLEHVTTPHGRECTCPLHVLLAAQCPLQMSPIAQPWYATSTPQCHVSYMLHCADSTPS